MEKELKPCPFCGQHAVIVSHPGINWDGSEKHINKGAMHGLWYVGCPASFFEGMVDDCEIKPSAQWYADLDKAIEAWNDRKPKKKPSKGKR